MRGYFLTSLPRIFVTRYISSKIPSKPVIPLDKVKKDENKVDLDVNTISLLERLSLVKCDTQEGVTVLEDAITFANKIIHIDTSNIEPMVTVLENK